MLDPKWTKVYDPNDFDKWRRMEATTPPFLENSFNTINELLKKYFITKAGGDLGPEKSWYQRKAILAATMEELERAASGPEERDPEEDLGAILEREKGEHEARISYRETP